MVFLFAFIGCIILNIIIIFSKIIVVVDNLKFTSKIQKHLNNDYRITIKLKIFNVITVFKTIYNKDRIEKINRKFNVRKKINKINMKKVLEERKKDNQFNKNLVTIVIKDVLKIEKINLKIELGIEDAAVTAIITGILSTILSNAINKKIKEIDSQKYEILPNYRDYNIIIINFSGIFVINVIHIINIIYILLKEKGEKLKTQKKFNYFRRKSYILGKESE